MELPTVQEQLRAGIRSGALDCRALPWSEQTDDDRKAFAKACTESLGRGEGHQANCMFSWAVDVIYALERTP